MNRQTFLDYLEEPSKLYQLPLIELQGLVLEYPYSPNLRLLLLLKARMENHPRQPEMIQQLASRTFDREHLYDLLRDLDRQEAKEASAKEEKLELQDLNKLDFAFATNSESDPAEMQSASLDVPVPSYLAPDDDLQEDEDKLPASNTEDNDLLPTTDEDVPPGISEEDNLSGEAATSGQNEVTSDESATTARLTEAFELDDIVATSTVSSDISGETENSYPYLAGLLATATGISEITRDYHANYQPPKPVPTEQLVTNREDTHAAPSKVKARLRRHRQQQLKRMKHRERDQLKEIARHSVSTHDELASETLAKLLTRQEQYAKAIKMYQQLSLQNPAKKTIFAGLIKELKEKL